MIARGSLYWVDLGPAVDSRPAKHRPVLVVQADEVTASRLSTVIAVVVTSNTALAAVPGNVFLPAAVTGLSRDSAANVTAIVTVDKRELTDRIGVVPEHVMASVDAGIRLVLSL